MNIGRRLRAAVATAVAVPAGLALTGGPASAVVSSADTTAGATTLAQVRSVIGADTGTAATLTGKGVGVALIDTGVASVPGLPAAQIVNGPDLSFESQAANLRYLDTYGHGTHMAGIIVGNDTATGAKGIAPGVKLTSVKIGTATGAVDVSQMIAALDWVVQHRNDDPANPIRVLNLSYGSGGSGQSWTDPLQFAVERAWKAGIVVVAAAGNNGNAAGTLTNPATDDWVLAVGATATNGTTATGDDTLATFTNLASTTTAGVAGQVDLLAPGTSIASLRVPGSNVDNLYPSARVGETLFKGSGTSQATAVVSAAAALLLQAKPAATPNQVKDWLIKGATALGTGTAKTLGLAELNVNGALARTGTTVTPPALQASSGAGSLQGSRGTSYLTLDGVKLTGERTVWGPFSSIQWAAATSWSGGLWLGYRLAGDGWTGTSWASKTWAAGTWSAAPWAGSAATGWSDPAWSGRTWSGRTWSAGTWSGRTWSSDGWSATAWS
ncbi:S8 family serine peptidase [Dactylosporangium aurantiacum]|uniref:S8 family serine peptidase n=1 Tax=Dactylosporangium aurantiacum TaxID=35754 RepID=A0A9Q9IS51_9ACTN|nr:S8 family serine peptidase [Dactylosporangium aurantiacum]MDG6103865.1 S8 family serine peptidase [Dactylosporangium aurantiacum]UWZ58940.1 S8 family serine peptidase [Dactylosporangium aurantiacum]